MKYPVALLKQLNRFFPLPAHPFNQGSYDMWQFERGAATIQNYAPFASPEEMFYGKTILDVGCGAGGKAVYYATLGAEKVIGIDIVKKYKEQAENLAKRQNVKNFEFILCDAADTKFDSESFDTVILNDSMEHVRQPDRVLAEMQRILKPNGRVYINFPPYYHPYGAHVSDAIGIPWVHLFFSENTLIQAYKDLAAKRPDGAERIRFRISVDAAGKEYFSYINKMTIRRLQKILSSQNLSLVYYREIPLRRYLGFFCHGFMRECMTRTVVAVLEKGYGNV